MDAYLRSRLTDGLNYYKNNDLTLEETLKGFETLLDEQFSSQPEPPVSLPKRELLEKLEFAQKELDMLYHFAISNGIAEAGKPPHKVIADYIKQIKQV
jgi:hypothetical protein